MEEMTINNLNDRDKVIRTLASVKFNCYLRTRTGICSINDCSICPRYKAYSHCLEQMSEFDKLQIDDYFDNEFHKVASSYCPRPLPKANISVKPKRNISSIISFIISALCLSGLFQFLFRGLK